MSSADHIVMDARTQEFRCEHCGQTYRPNLPAPVGIFVAIAKEFTQAHRNCLPQAPLEAP